jgi:hypothetical protein
MLTKAEQNFIDHWEAYREKEKNILRQLFFGLPFGLLLGVGVLIMLESGWYERANMVAYSQSKPWLLIVAIIAIAVFTGVFYKRFKWEMNEQRYKELLVKKRDQSVDTRATDK